MSNRKSSQLLEYLLDFLEYLFFRIKSTSINNWKELEKIRDNPDGTYMLRSDINIPEGEKFNYINEFRGEIYGNGYKITGLYIEEEEDKVGTGLFGKNKGRIEEIVIEDAFVNGFRCVGVIAGICKNGDIINCRVSDSFIESKSHTGGIAGYLDKSNSLTENCTVENTIIKGEQEVGGLVGKSCFGASRDCTVKNCRIEALSRGGSFMGVKDYGTISNCNVKSVNVDCDYVESPFVGHSTITNNQIGITPPDMKDIVCIKWVSEKEGVIQRIE